MAPAALTTNNSPTSTFASAFALTTTFTAPAQCAQAIGGLTMLQIDGFRIWLNAPLPVPGTTIMSCYPTEFASSFLSQRGGISQAAFSPLVCPQGYTTQGPFTSNYIACCPSGWDGFAPSPNAPPDRPAFGGTCFTNIYNKPIQITSYDNSAVKASLIFTATGTADQAFAYPYEGFAQGVVILASTVPLVPASTSAPSISRLRSTDSISTPTSVPLSASSAMGLSNTTVLAGVIVGSVLALLFLVSLIIFALQYRKRRMLPSSARGPAGIEYPNYAAHIRLNNDSPTPMIYLGQPPKVVTDWHGAERRDKLLDDLEAKSYEAGEAVDIKLEDQVDVKIQQHVHELQGDLDAKRQSTHEMEAVSAERKQSIYEMDAAVDAMMEDMVDMMRSKRLPPLPKPKEKDEES